MRTIQQIFDAVIFSGVYKDGFVEGCSQYMCHALDIAEAEATITAAECKKAHRSIELYLIDPKRTPLESALMLNDKPFDFMARRDIYLNWAKRPKLRKDVHV